MIPFCEVCTEEITLANRSKAGKNPDGTQKYRLSMCKDCHSKRVGHDQKVKRASIRPDKFNQCLDCLNIFFIRKGSDKCACGSTNIERCDS